MFKLEQLQEFIELCEFPSLYEYAKFKGVAHSKVSKMVNDLEDHFGCKLIQRSRVGSNKITEEGQRLFKLAPNLLKDAIQLKDVVRHEFEKDEGTFDLITTNVLLEHWISPNLGKFRSKYPGINLNLIPSEQIPDSSITKTTLSVCPEMKIGTKVKQKHLRDFNVGMWASKKYIKRFGKPEHVSDLGRHRLLCFSNSWTENVYPTLNWYAEHKGVSITPGNVTIIRSSLGILQAAKDGLGIFSLAQENIEKMGFEFERILPNITGPKIPMCFTYPEKWEHSKAIMSIQKFLMECFDSI